MTNLDDLLKAACYERDPHKIIAEAEDVANWIERTKPQGLLYESAMPTLREAAAALREAHPSPPAPAGLASREELIQRAHDFSGQLDRASDGGYTVEKTKYLCGQAVTLLSQLTTALALSQPPAAGGWKLVPREAVGPMLQVCMTPLSQVLRDDEKRPYAPAEDVRRIWTAMYDASPAHPEVAEMPGRSRLAKALYECRAKLRAKRNRELERDGLWPDHNFTPSDEQYADALISLISPSVAKDWQS